MSDVEEDGFGHEDQERDEEKEGNQDKEENENTEEEKVEQPDKKARVDYKCMEAHTQNVKDISAMIKAFCAFDNTKVKISFTPEGMEFFSTTSLGNILQTFYARSNFKTYTITESVQFVVAVSELKDLNKFISSDMEQLEMYVSTNDFIFSGTIKGKNGVSSRFNVAMMLMDTNTINVVDLSEAKFNIEVQTTSQNFADNMKHFASDSSIKIDISKDEIAFNQIGETGTTRKRIVQSIESVFDGKYSICVMRKWLDPILASRIVNPSLSIMFNTDETQSRLLQLKYKLDTEKSHLSMYIAVSVNE